MKRISLVKEAHSLIKCRLNPGAIAIDATAGNGHDTLFLSKQVTATGKVYAFDLQQAALDTTRSRLQQANLLDCLTLIQADHALMTEKIPVQHHGKISAVMFNLGYLPGGDKTIITLASSTLAALNSASRMLSKEGILTVLAYPGHEGGDIETEHVKRWCGQLNKQQFCVSSSDTRENNASEPVLFAIYKTV